MKEKEEKMHLPKVSIDDFFTSQEERDAQKLEKVQKISITEISNFPNHPFKVRDDEKMFETVESIKEHGVLVPAIVRPKEDGTYEMVSGHRRKRACELAQIEELPCIVRNLTDDEATIIMVDSNLQREQILPSERAFAYKMKLEAIKSQGKRNDLTSTQPVQKLSVEVIADEMGESRESVRRYIRLTELIPELLQFVDNHYLRDKENMTMALAPAIEISYLSKNEQDMLLEAMETSLATPSTPQAKRLREESEKGTLTEEKIQDEVKSLLEQKETEDFLWDKHLISNPKTLSEIYVLVNNKNPKNSVVVMYDTNTDNFCFIKPYMKKLEDKISSLEEWRFNYEEHLFEYLENDYQMFNSNDFVVHYNVWNYIEEMYPEEIENKKGMQNYLKYCKENGITKTKIENEVKCDVPDVMKLYKDKTKRKDDR